MSDKSTPSGAGSHKTPLYKPHPWHGISMGNEAPEKVTCFIEIVPSDTVKYEIDKATGYLKVDRPQKFSNVCPAPYGFIPQTLCGPRVADHCEKRTGRTGMKGDGDPLDICVLSERAILHGDILLEARPIGGMLLIDRNEADDKIIAVLKDDAAYGALKEIGDCPAALIERIRHYFLTYKASPGGENVCEIPHVYDSREAHEIILLSSNDYHEAFD